VRGCCNDALRSARGLPGTGSEGKGVCVDGDGGGSGDGKDDSLRRYSTHIFENDSVSSALLRSPIFELDDTLRPGIGAAYGITFVRCNPAFSFSRSSQLKMDARTESTSNRFESPRGTERN